MELAEHKEWVSATARGVDMIAKSICLADSENKEIPLEIRLRKAEECFGDYHRNPLIQKLRNAVESALRPQWNLPEALRATGHQQELDAVFHYLDQAVAAVSQSDALDHVIQAIDRAAKDLEGIESPAWPETPRGDKDGSVKYLTFDDSPAASSRASSFAEGIGGERVEELAARLTDPKHRAAALTALCAIDYEDVIGSRAWPALRDVLPLCLADTDPANLAGAVQLIKTVLSGTAGVEPEVTGQLLIVVLGWLCGVEVEVEIEEGTPLTWAHLAAAIHNTAAGPLLNPLSKVFPSLPRDWHFLSTSTAKSLSTMICSSLSETLNPKLGPKPAVGSTKRQVLKPLFTNSATAASAPSSSNRTAEQVPSQSVACMERSGSERAHDEAQSQTVTQDGHIDQQSGKASVAVMVPVPAALCVFAAEPALPWFVRACSSTLSSASLAACAEFRTLASVLLRLCEESELEDTSMKSPCGSGHLRSQICAAILGAVLAIPSLTTAFDGLPNPQTAVDPQGKSTAISAAKLARSAGQDQITRSETEVCESFFRWLVSRVMRDQNVKSSARSGGSSSVAVTTSSVASAVKEATSSYYLGSADAAGSALLCIAQQRATMITPALLHELVAGLLPDRACSVGGQTVVMAADVLRVCVVEGVVECLRESGDDGKNMIVSSKEGRSRSAAVELVVQMLENENTSRGMISAVDPLQVAWWAARWDFIKSVCLAAGHSGSYLTLRDLAQALCRVLSTLASPSVSGGTSVPSTSGKVTNQQAPRAAECALCLAASPLVLEAFTAPRVARLLADHVCGRLSEALEVQRERHRRPGRVHPVSCRSREVGRALLLASRLACSSQMLATLLDAGVLQIMIQHVAHLARDPHLPELLHGVPSNCPGLLPLSTLMTVLAWPGIAVAAMNSARAAAAVKELVSWVVSAASTAGFAAQDRATLALLALSVLASDAEAAAWLTSSRMGSDLMSALRSLISAPKCDSEVSESFTVVPPLLQGTHTNPIPPPTLQHPQTTASSTSSPSITPFTPAAHHPQPQFPPLPAVTVVSMTNVLAASLVHRLSKGKLPGQGQASVPPMTNPSATSANPPETAVVTTSGSKPADVTTSGLNGSRDPESRGPISEGSSDPSLAAASITNDRSKAAKAVDAAAVSDPGKSGSASWWRAAAAALASDIAAGGPALAGPASGLGLLVQRCVMVAMGGGEESGYELGMWGRSGRVTWNPPVITAPLQGAIGPHRSLIDLVETILLRTSGPPAAPDPWSTLGAWFDWASPTSTPVSPPSSVTGASVGVDQVLSAAELVYHVATSISGPGVLSNTQLLVDHFLLSVHRLWGASPSTYDLLSSLGTTLAGPFIWPALDARVSQGSALRRLLAAAATVASKEIPAVVGALEGEGVSVTLVCLRWLQCSFRTILTEDDAVRMFCVALVMGVDFMVYSCISLLQHYESYLLSRAAEGRAAYSVATLPGSVAVPLTTMLPIMLQLRDQYRPEVFETLMSIGSENMDNTRRNSKA